MVPVIPVTTFQIVIPPVLTDRDDGSISRSPASEFQVVSAGVLRESLGGDLFLKSRVRYFSDPLLTSGGKCLGLRRRSEFAVAPPVRELHEQRQEFVCREPAVHDDR